MLRHLIRLARPDVRVHVRRKVVQIPVRQTALRAVATVATEQGEGRSPNPLIFFILIVPGQIMVQILPRFFPFVLIPQPVSRIMENPIRARLSEGKPSEPPFAEGMPLRSSPFRCYAATGGLQERLAPTLVYTSVARECKFQDDRPHFVPSPR